jgi:2-dehydropantoate 2-reductase
MSIPRRIQWNNRAEKTFAMNNNGQDLEQKLREMSRSGKHGKQDLDEMGLVEDDLREQDYQDAAQSHPQYAFACIFRDFWLIFYCRMVHSPPGRVARRIHVFASNPDARFLAHSFKSIPQAPPVTLLFHNKSYQRSWLESGATLSIEYPDGTEVTESGFQAELARSPFRSHGRIVMADDIISRKIRPHWDRNDTENHLEFPINKSMLPDGSNDELISNLVLCSRPQGIIPALLAVRHRLTNQSTIFIITQGMGVVEAIYEKVFPDPQTRPGIVLGLMTHLIHSLPAARDPHFLSHEQTYFRVLRWKQTGTLSVCALPRWDNLRDPEAFRAIDDVGNGEDVLNATTRYLLRTLRRTPILVPTFMKPVEFHLHNLETVAVQAILQPILALLDGRQGHALYNFQVTVAMRILAHEISLVLRSLPEIQSYPNLEERFSPSRFIRMVTSICFEAKNRIHPSVYEMRQGNSTGIDYLNGYIVKRGEEQGLSPVVNYFIKNLIRGKSVMVKHELEEQGGLGVEEFPRDVAGARYQ